MTGIIFFNIYFFKSCCRLTCAFNCLPSVGPHRSRLNRSQQDLFDVLTRALIKPVSSFFSRASGVKFANSFWGGGSELQPSMWRMFSYTQVRKGRVPSWRNQKTSLKDAKILKAAWRSIAAAATVGFSTSAGDISEGRVLTPVFNLPLQLNEAWDI